MFMVDINMNFFIFQTIEVSFKVCLHKKHTHLWYDDFIEHLTDERWRMIMLRVIQRWIRNLIKAISDSNQTQYGNQGIQCCDLQKKEKH